MNKQVQPHEKDLTGTLEWILVGGVGEEIAIGLFPAGKNWCGLVWIELAIASWEQAGVRKQWMCSAQ